MQCGKCNAAMDEGFVVDYAAGGNRKVAEWVQGEPKGSFWHGVDLSSARQMPIVTYRCAACGYLEFYARGKRAWADSLAAIRLLRSPKNPVMRLRLGHFDQTKVLFSA